MEFGLSGAIQPASSSLAGRRLARDPAGELIRELDSVMEVGLKQSFCFGLQVFMAAIAGMWFVTDPYGTVIPNFFASPCSLRYTLSSENVFMSVCLSRKS